MNGQIIRNRYEAPGLLGPWRRFVIAVKDRYPYFFERYLLPISRWRQDRKFRPIIMADIKKIYSDASVKLFDKVEIETINRCNESCSFCPVNRHSDSRPFQRMEESLFRSIIEQLRALEYSGVLGLYSNNEPLMDKRIIDLCKIARQALPKAFLYLYTNGTLLNMERFKQLMDYLDRLYINNYNDDLTLNKPVQEIYEYCANNGIFSEKLRILLRKSNELLTTRGGQAKNRGSIIPLKSSCVLPFSQLVIRPSGQVSLCSFDALGHTTMGDLTKNSILEVWNNQKYREYREKILNGRGHIDICSRCDFFTALKPDMRSF